MFLLFYHIIPLHLFIVDDLLDGQIKRSNFNLGKKIKSLKKPAFFISLTKHNLINIFKNESINYLILDDFQNSFLKNYTSVSNRELTLTFTAKVNFHQLK